MYIELIRYFTYLMEDNANFGDMPVCPFLKAELDTMVVEEFNPRQVKESLIDRVIKWNNEKKKKKKSTSILFLQFPPENHNNKDLHKWKYQAYLNQLLINNEITHNLKSICFDPNEFFTPAGEATRELAPTFLIAITTHDRLADSHKKLLKTNWFDTYKKHTFRPGLTDSPPLLAEPLEAGYDPLDYMDGEYEIDGMSYKNVYITNENKRLFDKFLNF